jgi:cytidine deaminase
MSLKPETHVRLNARLKAQLMTQAAQAAKTAYAPYSRFKVGAALLTGDGTIYLGCNVENASFGLTVCAERVAVFAAVAARGARAVDARALAVTNIAGKTASPCGACRQVLQELAPDAVVLYRGDSGVVESSVTKLLPSAFRMAPPTERQAPDMVS